MLSLMSSKSRWPKPSLSSTWSANDPVQPDQEGGDWYILRACGPWQEIFCYISLGKPQKTTVARNLSNRMILLNAHKGIRYQRSPLWEDPTFEYNDS